MKVQDSFFVWTIVRFAVHFKILRLDRLLQFLGLPALQLAYQKYQLHDWEWPQTDDFVLVIFFISTFLVAVLILVYLVYQQL